MGINKKSTGRLSRAEERRASNGLSLTEVAKKVGSYTDFRRSSSEIYMLRPKRDLDRQAKPLVMLESRFDNVFRFRMALQLKKRS